MSMNQFERAVAVPSIVSRFTFHASPRLVEEGEKLFLRQHPLLIDHFLVRHSSAMEARLRRRLAAVFHRLVIEREQEARIAHVMENSRGLDLPTAQAVWLDALVSLARTLLAL